MNKGEGMTPPDFKTYYIAALILTVSEEKTHRLVQQNREHGSSLYKYS